MAGNLNDSMAAGPTTDAAYTDTVTTSYTTGEEFDSQQFNTHDKSEQIKTVFAAIGMFGCPSNLLVIMVVLASPRMRGKPFNILIVHQACIDLMVIHVEVAYNF